ncbi:MAG: HNH endonuclease [Terracidiphilus sp.]|jgi:5-methylcytosine-specific restriction endonuclease McrA
MKYELQTLDEYSDEALLAELRRVTGALNGQRLTRERFNSIARVHSSTLENHFGSWREALDKAEISEVIAPRYRVLSREEVIQVLRDFATEYPNTPVTLNAIAERLGVDKGSISRRFGNWKTLLSEVGIAPVPMGRRYTEEECFENILTLWTHYGRQPHFGELKYPPSTVGPKAYILRWGGWRATLSAFVKQINNVETPPAEINSVEFCAEKRGCATVEVPAPQSIPLALRYRILSRDRFRCVLCGASPAKDVAVELHVDHIYPRSRGGQSIEENLRTLCLKCNLGKGDKIEDAGLDIRKP